MTLLLLLACTPSPKPTDDSAAPAESAADSRPDSGSDSTPDSTGDSEDSAPAAGNLPPSAEECGASFPTVDPNGSTMPQGAGPNWREDTPERKALNVWEEAGTRLILSLRLVDTGGRPLVGRRLTVWGVGANTRYDVETADANGYGWQLSDAEGRVCVSMNRPLPYASVEGSTNPAHIHLAVGDDAIEANQVLFTQYFFGDDPWLTEVIPPELTFTPEILATGERIRSDIVLP